MDLISLRHCSVLRAAGFSLAAAGMLVALLGAAQDVDQAAEQPTTRRSEPQRLVPEAVPEPEEPAAKAEPQFFSSLEAGFELKMPDGVRLPDDRSDTLAVVVDMSKGWRFEVQRLSLSSPAKLETRQLPEGGTQAGLLEVVTQETVRESNAEVLRSEVTPLGEGEAGVIIARTTTPTLTQLRQIALIPFTDVLYHRVVMTSPAPAGEVEALAEDENVQQAAAAFSEALNTFKRLDQAGIREDQEERLLRTRALFVNLTRPNVLQVLEPEQWWRIRKDNEDIGWAHVREHTADRIPSGRGNDDEVDPQVAEGVRVGIQTHLVTDEATIDRFTWLWSSFDRREGKFLEESVLTQDGQISQEGFVAGSMTARRVPKKVRVPRATGVGADEVMEIVDERRLEVSVSVGDEPPTSLVRELPAWYLQQAMAHLLPRLVAPWGRRTYLVAVYNPEQTEIWQQYVDVEGPRNETVFGEKQLVMIVTTRMGLSGDPTTHYISTDGYRWLGSMNEATGVEIRPVDEATLRSVWGAEVAEEADADN